MTQRVHRGLAHSAEFLASYLGSVPWERVLLVCHPSSFQKSGAADWLENHTATRPPVFSDFSANPKSEDVVRGVAQFQAMHAQAILAIGGGSILDMAKLINFFGTQPIAIDRYLDDPISSDGELKPLLAVPTTAGSGSEATHFAVVYRGSTKYSVATDALRPSHVLLAPEFTFSLPAYITACTGFDALAQAIESHWARKATAESRCHSQQALASIREHLQSAVLAPTRQHRAAMLDAAYSAGRAIDSTQTTGAHAYSYALTATYGFPHGHAVALLLPFFVELHRAAGIQVPGITANSLRMLAKDIGLSQTLPDTADAIHALLSTQVNQQRLSNNPVPVPAEFVRRMAEELAQS